MRDDWKPEKLSSKLTKSIAVPITVGVLIFGICITIAVFVVMFKPNSFDGSELSADPELGSFDDQTTSTSQNNGNANDTASGHQEQLQQSVSDSENQSLFVHVTGEVEYPGVVEVPAGSRVIDAINAAGGVVGDAATSAINLARLVNDGEQVFVPDKDDLANLEPGETISNLVSPDQPDEASGLTNPLVNINSANIQELETLSGIGPAIAARIVTWREENGSFVAVEDLMHVSGIGPKMFENLVDKITV